MKNLPVAIMVFLYGSIRKRFFRLLLIKTIAKLEGGQMLSPTIRKLFLKYHQVQVGLHSYGCFDYRNIRPGVKIGKFCSFGRNVVVFDANHPIMFKSTHPYFYEPGYGFVDEFKAKRVPKVIENDVWIGNNALILPNVKRIGNGAIIGAGSVVTKDVPDYAVVGGNPAKVIRYRFSDETIAKLLEEKWWDNSMEDIKTNIRQYLEDIE